MSWHLKDDSKSNCSHSSRLTNWEPFTKTPDSFNMNAIYRPSSFGKNDSYEEKRAGSLYEQYQHYNKSLLNMDSSISYGELFSNANNNVQGSDIVKDVQKHRSNDGKKTTITTELRPNQQKDATNLNIRISLDSDSNMSNSVVRHFDDSARHTSTNKNTRNRIPTSRDSGLQVLRGNRNISNDTDDFFDAEADDMAIELEKEAQIEIDDDNFISDNESDNQAIQETVSESIDQNITTEETPLEMDQEVPEFSPQDTKSADDELDFTDESPGTPYTPGLEDEDEDEDKAEKGGNDMEDEAADEAAAFYKRFTDGQDIDKLRGPLDPREKKETIRQTQTGHLMKEGVVIGSMNIFADVHVKEYVVLLTDKMVEAFLIDPGRFRSVAYRTKCEIEVTRRILNRRMGRYRWLKYLIILIRGPTYSAIDQCDKLMITLFPPYKNRKAYGQPACMSMFLREDIPDNSDLFLNFQRTGPALPRFGEIPLTSPFKVTKDRPLSNTPWKLNNKRAQWGSVEPKNDPMEFVMAHTYPERGNIVSNAMDHQMKWADAANKAIEMEKERALAAMSLGRQRRADMEPLYAAVTGDD